MYIGYVHARVASTLYTHPGDSIVAHIISYHLIIQGLTLFHSSPYFE